MLLGYARVSTDAQSLEAQTAALKAESFARIRSRRVFLTMKTCCDTVYLSSSD
jgi:DNA invertase Pin-like site-specific DNA recombinase